MPNDEIEVEQDLATLPVVRQFVRERLRRWDAEELMGPVVLLTTELVSNAVRHGAEPIGVQLTVERDRARVVVSDGSPTPPVVRQPTAFDTSGRGLRWVSQFSSTWGHQALPGDGKAVWFEVGGQSAGHEP